MVTFRRKLDQLGLSSVKIEDFYEKAGEIEKSYLKHLTSLGSCADMIKTHALIDPNNEKRQHLQMGSNTQIRDYLGLYNTTFGSREQCDLLALNASYYDQEYISAHNKIVYTAPGSNFIKVLRNVHLKYCDIHANDHETNPEEKSKKSSIYAKDFVVALEELGLTRSIELTGRDYIKPRKIYPAVLERTEAYRLTKYVITAVNKTWSDERNPDLKKLKVFPLERAGDTVCDYASFVTSVKKFFGQMNMHKYGEYPDHWRNDLQRQNNAGLENDSDTRRHLLNLLNTVVDKIVIARFYDSAVDYVEKNVKNHHEKHLLMELIAKNFNLQPIRGNILVKELFGCTLDELIVNPFIHSKKFKLAELRSYMKLEIVME